MEQGTEFSGDWRAVAKGDFLAAVEFGDRTATFTVKKIHKATLEVIGNDDDGPKKMKDRLVLYFVEVEGRGLVLNRTNATCLASLWGSTQTKDWVGRKVTLCAEMVQVGPKKELGIRVKGSPEIKEPMHVKIELPRRKPILRTLVPTGRPATEPARQREPGDDDDRDEVAR